MFKFSQRSLDKLQGVHPDLVAVTKLAIQYSEVDFSITEGVRTLEKQKQNYANGKSKTINGSKHLPQKDGFSHAVDTMALVRNYEGRLESTWDFDEYYKIAEAFKRAAKELGIQIRWGGGWSCDDLATWEGSMQELTESYKKKQRAKGLGSFLDGVHFELYGIKYK